LWPRIDADEKRRRLNSEIDRLKGEQHKLHQSLYAATRADSSDTERLANLNGFSRLIGDRVFMVSVESDAISNRYVLIERLRDTHNAWYKKVQKADAKAGKRPSGSPGSPTNAMNCVPSATSTASAAPNLRPSLRQMLTTIRSTW
jgi:hypothetical protein